MILLVLSLMVLVLAIGLYHANKALPDGLSVASPDYYADDVRFFRDLTWVDQDGNHCHDHQIFDEILNRIQAAQRIILLDMFLFNHLRGKAEEGFRDLSDELTNALVKQKKRYPAIDILFITDPINTTYGGDVNPYVMRLEKAGIRVLITKLEPLRDSNFLYSPFWRLFIRPFGNKIGGWLPNPFGAGKVTMRSYFRMLNFKANHRKLIVTDQGDRLAALVTSANPHDGSSSHGNVAIGFSGQAARFLFESEKSVIKLSADNTLPLFEPIEIVHEKCGINLKILTEGRIKQAILTELGSATAGDTVMIVQFYLSDRDVIASIKEAASVGVSVKVILDPNKDAFGRKKIGIPNRQTAAELIKCGVAVRWGNTNGEQLHSKLFLVDYESKESCLILGSANLTRRNLDDYNLETNVQVKGGSVENVIRSARDYFDLLWNNDQGRVFSLDYEVYEDRSVMRKILYRFVEATGLCTF